MIKFGVDFLKYRFTFLYSLFSGTIRLFRELSSDVINYFRNLRKELPNSYNKILNLYETNMQLGLMHFYNGKYQDAKFRFTLMRIFCRENPVIAYNIARCHYQLQNEDSTKKFLKLAQALGMQGKEEITYYLDKLARPGSIESIPFPVLNEKILHDIQYEFEKYDINYNTVLDKILMFHKGKKLSSNNILEIHFNCKIFAPYLFSSQKSRPFKNTDCLCISEDIEKLAKRFTKDTYKNFFCNNDVIDFITTQQSENPYGIIVINNLFDHYSNLELTLQSLKKSALCDSNTLVILILQAISRSEEFDGDIFFDPYTDSFAYDADYIASQCEKYCKIHSIDQFSLSKTYDEFATENAIMFSLTFA